jgi:hypothetical protein
MLHESRRADSRGPATVIAEAPSNHARQRRPARARARRTCPRRHRRRLDAQAVPLAAHGHDARALGSRSSFARRRWTTRSTERECRRCLPTARAGSRPATTPGRVRQQSEQSHFERGELDGRRPTDAVPIEADRMVPDLEDR